MIDFDALEIALKIVERNTGHVVTLYRYDSIDLRYEFEVERKKRHNFKFTINGFELTNDVYVSALKIMGKLFDEMAESYEIYEIP